MFTLLFFSKTLLIFLTIFPEKSRRVRKIEVSTNSVPEFELGDTAGDIHWKWDEREAREREET